ncbi:hypothetical protein VTK26DRAFT_504 [Humicola hyalothermophila]
MVLLNVTPWKRAQMIDEEERSCPSRGKEKKGNQRGCGPNGRTAAVLRLLCRPGCTCRPRLGHTGTRTPTSAKGFWVRRLSPSWRLLGIPSISPWLPCVVSFYFATQYLFRRRREVGCLRVWCTSTNEGFQANKPHPRIPSLRCAINEPGLSERQPRVDQPGRRPPSRILEPRRPASLPSHEKNFDEINPHNFGNTGGWKPLMPLQ